MIQIDSGYFCAAVILENGTVTQAAPILSYMRGWTKQKVIQYCNRKKWRFQELHEQREETKSEPERTPEADRRRGKSGRET